MPSLSFSIFKEKLLSGTKCQTIRKPRKRPLKVGDKLYVFWKLRTKECERLGESKIISIKKIRLGDLTEEDALKDGFEEELRSPYSLLFNSAKGTASLWFLHKYPNVTYNSIFEIISFEPLKKDLKPTSVEFGTFEEFWKYCNGGCPNYKEGCATTCELRRKLKISPFGTFKWQGEIPKNE